MAWSGGKEERLDKTCHIFTLHIRRTAGLKYVLGRFSIIILTYILTYLLT
jgi:hypothetical protein